VDSRFQRDALFGGMTSNAYKLGTVLSLGWFWMRPAGCGLLYRGLSIETIDTRNILAVAAADASQVSPPQYAEHQPGGCYYYLLQRATGWGSVERTMQALAKVSFDNGGKLAQPRSNNVFAAAGEQVNGLHVRLCWYYCTLQQQAKPVRFRIYYDGGTGSVDFENPLATIPYQPGRCHVYQSGELSAGRYRFCIRAEDADGRQNAAVGPIEIELRSPAVPPGQIITAESL